MTDNTTKVPGKTLALYLSKQKVPFGELKDQFRYLGASGLIYRGVPFWSWNGDLEPGEIRRQIREFNKADLAGFFMHGR
jgi:hypothetical protein